MSYARKRYVFTINNPTFEDYCAVVEFCTTSNCCYAVVGEEVGEKGTPHLQGFVNLRCKQRPKRLEELLGGRAWISPARGSDLDNKAYCQKERPYLECGEPQRQGQRSDLRDAVTALDEGMSLCDVARKWPVQYVMFGRGLQSYVTLTSNRQRDWKTEVIILIGPPGCGKSRWAWEFESPAKYYKARGKWWDGYDGHETVVMDDFYGWLPYDDMLRICDRYPLRVETKGGSTQFLAKHVIVTSNRPPEEWYKEQYDQQALYRRITKYMIYEIDKFIEAPACMLKYPINC